MGQAGESELSGLSAQAVLLVGLEYQALGISDAVQMNYLMQTGGRMLGLTLLMVAAAVLVGLLASRVAACHCAGSAPRCVSPGGQLFCL